jgi:type I restriction enzyme M protein
LFWLKDANASDPDSPVPPAELAVAIVASLEKGRPKFQPVTSMLSGI